ncbi:hypothetical protein POL68_35210 [Stigmatella sp. ncwal1]|uniref:Uncharacterized protein n=1 Tax=Stigmatella ashevillensis TaxID=2995309 RepID=A0ABT5DL65_9BACT|nr:hypothetical protein [Stigmatella ashevillena]MDC0713769.1 hypothetical protein [Stigmatella ashevillena]
MKKKLLTGAVFLFGLGLGGATASASGGTQDGTSPGITPEMALCVAECKAAGGTHAVCWACCVNNICPVD